MKRKPNSTAKVTGMQRRTRAELRIRAGEKEHQPMMAELRRRAEVQMRQRRQKPPSGARAEESTADAQRVLHELQVHQIELEMQNAELQEARNRMETQLEKYTDLYDFAPVGYFSLDEQGAILEVNLSGAALLGVERSRLLNRRLARFVAPASQSDFLAFLKRVFAGTGQQDCDLAMVKEDDAAFWGRFRGIFALAASGPRKWCRVSVADITLFRQAKDVLVRNEKLFTALVQQAPLGVYVVDSQLRLQQLNPKAQPIFSKVQPLIGRELPEIMRILWPKPTAEEIVAHFRHTLQTGEPYRSSDFFARRRDLGGTEFYEWQLQRLTLPAGDHGVVCFFDNITDRKLAEQALHESQERMRLATEATAVGIWEWNLITDRIRWDAQMFRLYGLAPTADGFVDYRDWSAAVLPEDLPQQEKLLKKMLREGRKSGNREFRIRRRGDKSIRQIQAVETVRKNAQGRPEWVLGTNLDITERKRVEEASARLAAIVQSSEDAIIGKDLHGIITSWNRGATRLFGYQAKEAIGQSVTILMPPGGKDEEVQILERITRGEPTEHYESVRRHKDGRLLDVSLTVSPIADAHGRIVGASKIARDITAHKRAEAAQRRVEVLAASNRKLEQEIVRRKSVEKALQKSEQHQRQLLKQSQHMQERLRHLSRQILEGQEEERKRISRELHDQVAQTLVGMNVHLESLSKEATVNPDRLKQKIVQAQHLIEKSVDVVHRFARDLRPTLLDDLGLIPALNAYLKEFTERTKVRIHFKAFAGVERLSNHRRTVLYRVAQSALANIAQHAHATEVKVNIQRIQDTACLEIHDNGKSFDVERVLFAKRYKRLGLLGTRERVEMVDGSFKVESAPGKGTTIRAQVPFSYVNGHPKHRSNPKPA